MCALVGACVYQSIMRAAPLKPCHRWLLASPEVDLNKGGGGAFLYLTYCKDMPVLSVKLAGSGERGFEYIDVNLRGSGTVID